MLLATDRASYGNLAQLITRGRRQATKGSYRALPRRRRDVRGGSARAVDAAGCPTRARAAGDADALAAARWVAATFPGPRLDRRRALRPRRRPRAPRALRGSSRGRPGCRRSPPATSTCTSRARRALQDTLTAIRLRKPLAECGYALFPNGERHLRSRARLATIYPPALLAETVAIARRCTFSLDELRYEYPEEIVPPGATPASHLRKLTEAGLARRYGAAAVAARGPRADRARARADRRARLRALLPHRPRHRRVRALAGRSSARAAARRPTRPSATRSASPRSTRRG